MADEIDTLGKILRMALKDTKMELHEKIIGNEIALQKSEAKILDQDNRISEVVQNAETTSLQLEEFQEKQEKENIDLATMVATEKMKAKIEEEQLQREFESLNSKVKEVQDSLEENIEKILKEKEEEDKKLKNIDQLNELVDRKIQDVYEKMRGDNLYIWKESISLAEKEFSSKGLKETLSLLPKLPYDSADLKRTINSLIDKEDQVPPSIVKFNHQA